MFELGFFSPGTSKNRYVGIWYKKISTGTVVRVANRETPITDKLGRFKLSRQGDLLILSGENRVIWSSNSAVSTMVVAQLLNTGNLVMWDRSNMNGSNTFLPGMKMGKDLVTGREQVLTPWKSADDPSQGEYLHWLDTNRYPQMFVRQGSVIRRRHGPWNGLKFQSWGMENPSPIYSVQFVFNEKEIYIKYEIKSSVIQRVILLPDDTRVHLRWMDQIQDWAVHPVGAKESCGGYGLCGSYGIYSVSRHPLCNCMVGFRPRVPDEWVRANGSSWCERSGCLLWFHELMDTTENDDKQDLYIKLAVSELAGNEDSPYSINKKKRLITLVLSTTSVVLLLFAVAYACIKTEKSLHMRERGNKYALDKKDNNMLIDDLEELPLFSLNKMGVSEDGQDVAVKRLSKTSLQGIDEFKNEIICIAKLQHRNLVKLLGYCNDKNELILIYEYMTNKSLDLFIFDETRGSMLGWPQRLNIIHGIDRGILYLHQDSRLQIIHRDLKAGNTLLDGDMNPKISDFGLARKFVGSDTATKTKKVVGTYGYISPEYALHGRFSIKSDVYNFGVLVLEIVSGKKNREFSHDDRYDNLLGDRLYKQGSGGGVSSNGGVDDGSGNGGHNSGGHNYKVG
ncbi:hypothetical protein M8C21_002129 [Ambrosia artemisiifolia]|uniref:Uncharacterized protein n=1 Tax=Ambrosia artemisiifolia TaxID=4212 RepID=A0AAD5CHU6_AMBAR|nr:hypothetical protein M8C21_002129 [Ambrosia artemisiifolia]